MKQNRIEIFSPHSPTECVARLLAASDKSERFLDMFGRPSRLTSVVGRVSEKSITLRKRMYRGQQNSFQTFFLGSMKSADGGTLISGRFSMHPLIIGFMAFWFLGVISFLVLFGFATPGKPYGSDPDGLGFSLPVMMLAFGIALVAFGRFCARNEAKFLAAFLVQTLEAGTRTPDAPR